MTTRPRIYLDHAATSWPKPETVYAAVEHYQRHVGVAAGRSPYAAAVQVTQGVEQTRRACAALLGVRRPEQVVFTSNGTDALNLAIHGSLRPGDHVITTVAEHNSVLRPLAQWEARGQAKVTRVGCDGHGFVDPDMVRKAITPHTRLVVVTHASNVTGAVQPVAEIAAVAHEIGAIVLVDAAQTAGHWLLDMEAMQIDLLATSGHKGLLGPLGTGLLAIRPGLETELRSLRQGGTGTRSDDERQPDEMPGKYESGNLNVPGILGLQAGVHCIRQSDPMAIADCIGRLTAQLLDGLRKIKGIRLYGPLDIANRVGLVSLSLEGYDPQEAAALLDANYGIQVRPGLHCAPGMHRALGTLERGGTLRLSPGRGTTCQEIDTALAAFAALAAS